MEICKLILHIMDTTQNIFVPSDMELEKINEEVYPLVESKLKKVFNSQDRKQAQFRNSIIEKWIFNYKTNAITFIELSQQIASHIFDEKRKYNIFHTSDFILAEVKVNDIRYIVGIDNANAPKLTHTTKEVNHQILNEIISYKTLFSNSIMKYDRIFIVEYSNSSLQLIENPYCFNTNKIYVLQEILQCTSKPSYKETVAVLSDSVEMMSEKYNMDHTQNLSTLKTLLMESVEEQKIVTDEIAETIFQDKIVAKRDFKDELQKNGIEECILLENVKPRKSDKTQKIKTDNGIEITIPIDFMTNKEHVEFVTENDGTISIKLKNIQSIISK